MNQQHLIQLRHNLHQFPEISGKEANTSKLLRELLQHLQPDQLFNFIGSHSLVAIFDSFKEGNTVIFRADIDALPIKENNLLEYRSQNPGISHKCGHDGHSTILYGFAEYVSKIRPISGKVILLFQAAEETGEGALKIIDDLAPFKPDYCFGLHNLPGFPENSIVIKDGSFASSSIGMKIMLTGLSTHASEPEKGINPAVALADILKKVPGFATGLHEGDDYSMITITHAKLGDPSFGISASEAVIMLTLRGSSDRHISDLKSKIVEFVYQTAKKSRLTVDVEYSDCFPTTINDNTANGIIRLMAGVIGLKTIEILKPFRWSEDFAHYSKICPGALFGIGAGENCLPLHNQEYDFPDNIIQTGVEIWKAIYTRLNLNG